MFHGLVEGSLHESVDGDARLGGDVCNVPVGIRGNADVEGAGVAFFGLYSMFFAENKIIINSLMECCCKFLNRFSFIGKDIMILSAVMAVIACIAAFFVAHKWLEQFAEKVSLNPLYFLGGAILVLLIVLGVVVLNCLRIARANPVESITSGYDTYGDSDVLVF